MTPNSRLIVRGMNWMGGLSLLLFWLPGVGPFVAGLVGGFKAQTVGNATLAVFVPGVLLGVMSFAAVTWMYDASWGALAGVGTAVLLLINIGPLFLGAVLGALGWLAIAPRHESGK
jgi:hypothetical protein